MSRPVALVLLLAGLAPWAFLLVLQAIAALGVVAALGDPLGCVADAPAATAGMVWLAVGPVLVGGCAAVAVLRRGGPAAGTGARWVAAVGLGLLVVGLPLALVASGRPACPAADLAGDGGEGVPIGGWAVGAVVILLLTFGAICAAGLRVAQAGARR